MEFCNVCSEYVEKTDMSKYKRIDLFTEPTCDKCIDDIGADISHNASIVSYKNISLKSFNDLEKEAYYKLQRKLYRISNPEKFTRRLKPQEKVYKPYKKEILKIYKMCRRLNSKREEDYEVDHIVPIKGNNVCGLHLPCNLKIIPKSENRSKHNKFDEPYYIYYTYGGRELTFSFEHLDNEAQKEVMKLITAMNEHYTNKFKQAMVVLMDKMIHDTLCIEDFEEICSDVGVDIISEYNKMVDMMEEDELDDYLNGKGS